LTFRKKRNSQTQRKSVIKQSKPRLQHKNIKNPRNVKEFYTDSPKGWTKRLSLLQTTRIHSKT